MGTNYQILGWVRSTMAYCKVHDNQAYKKVAYKMTWTQLEHILGSGALVSVDIVAQCRFERT